MTIPQKSTIKWTPDARSKENLKQVHPDQVLVITRAQEICFARYGWYFVVIEGVRSAERQRVLYGQGRTAKQCLAAGINASYAKPKLPIVTHTLISNHFVKKDGFSHATDVCHFVAGQPIWDDCVKIAECMYEAAAELNVPIRWGKDWNRNGKPGEKGEYDGPHFELWGPRYA